MRCAEEWRKCTGKLRQTQTGAIEQTATQQNYRAATRNTTRRVPVAFSAMENIEWLQQVGPSAPLHFRTTYCEPHLVEMHMLHAVLKTRLASAPADTRRIIHIFSVARACMAL